MYNFHNPCFPHFSMLSVVEPASQLSCLRAFGLALARDKGLTLASAEFTIRHDLLRSLLDRGNVGGLIGNGLLEALLQTRSAIVSSRGVGGRGRTIFSKAHWLSFHSKGRHCHICWLWLSRHFQ